MLILWKINNISSDHTLFLVILLVKQRISMNVCDLCRFNVGCGLYEGYIYTLLTVIQQIYITFPLASFVNLLPLRHRPMRLITIEKYFKKVAVKLFFSYSPVFL
jgi:hypothetical protein